MLNLPNPDETMPVWHSQLPPCIIGFKKYLAVLEFTPPHEFSLHIPRDFQAVLENTVYKVEDLGGTSWKMTILNIRSLASLATIRSLASLVTKITILNIRSLASLATKIYVSI